MISPQQTNTITAQEFGNLWGFLGRWRQSFDAFDLDRTGNINKQEMYQALQRLRYNFQPQFVDLVFKKFDYRNVGTLQFDGFVHALIVLRRLTNGFARYDTNRNGQANFSYEQFMATVLMYF